jgi:hypothetical protein
MNYLTEGWPLGPTSTVYMDGTGVYRVRKYDEPGILASVTISQGEADAIRKVVAEGLVDVRNKTVADVLCALNSEVKANYSTQLSEEDRVALVTATLEHVITLFSEQRAKKGE